MYECLHACMYVHHMYTLCQKNPEEDTESLGPEVTESFELQSTWILEREPMSSVQTTHAPSH